MNRLDLLAAGWSVTRGGRWSHPEFPGEHGRRRLFDEGQALTLLDAATPDTRTPQEIVADVVADAFRIQAEIDHDALRSQHTCDEGVIP